MQIIEIEGYRVIRQLGAGGIGQVFLTQHPRPPRQEALKLLGAGVSRNDFKVRFQREADLLAQLSQPNIVTLNDRGEFEGRLWITMEYIQCTGAPELPRIEEELLRALNRARYCGRPGLTNVAPWRRYHR